MMGLGIGCQGLEKEGFLGQSQYGLEIWLARGSKCHTHTLYMIYIGPVGSIFGGV